MKKILFTVVIATSLVACNNTYKTTDTSTDQVENNISSAEESTQGKGKIEFENNTFEFGTVKEGAVVDHVFKFKNTGTEPVILAQVSATCGCTTPDYTKEPVLPGKDGEIKVSFDSHGQVGIQQKIITIASNAENGVTTVQLKGTVEK